MWEAALKPRLGGGSPSQDVMCDAVSAVDLSDEVGRLTEAMVPPVSRGDQRALGSRVNTIWGVATIMSVAPNGGYMCSWPHLKEEFQMEFFSDNEPIPEGSRRRSKRHLSEVSCVV